MRGWLKWSGACVLFVISVGSVTYIAFATQGRLDVAMAELESARLEMGGISGERDALRSRLRAFDSHAVMVSRMEARDAAGDTLVRRIGGPVWLKRDSARCILVDVVSGGGRFDYYVRCTAMRRDGSRLDVAPEELSFTAP